MFRFRMARCLPVLLASVVLMSCADYKSPTAPASDITQVSANGSQANLLSGLLGVVNQVLTTVTGTLFPEGKTVTAVKWAPSHNAAEYRASATIGYWGGTINVPGADFSITFPVGAVSQPTAITIIAMNGQFVAYDMLPHGLKFAKPVLAKQGFRNTAIYNTAAATTAQGAYLPDGKETIDANGLATTVETLTSTTLNVVTGLLSVPQSQIWEIKHFSRYILVSGCEGAAPPSSDPE